ncbi:pyridoxamine 5'-phosphate oxidase family protein [Nitriliruptor alkaliphilus]|uniref:pyridoxamine 5'-phosphate oxidase family protein n=1 Tax=Nitriliruptor alkaliphilus TaxID=427918 RepID=UPI000698AA14|nr:pyridoxamine 5'-phosphate oxidase family protein [Nitriliruptor alkaliphilus]
MAIRARIRLTDDEIGAFLAAPHKMQLATIDPDGAPHLVAMYYAPRQDPGAPVGGLAFWTYRRSQKARNLERDPRCTVMVEAGDDYDQLHGVSITGTVTATDDVGEVLRIGTSVYGRYLGDALPDGIDGFLEDQARKRRAYVLTPTKVASWDHRKLAAAYAGAGRG